MQLDRPLRVVGPSVDGDVLYVLARAEAEFTPPMVHELLGEHSESGIRRAMQRLAGQGILLHRRAGNAVLYQLNRDHLAAPAIRELATQKDVLLARLRERLAAWAPPATFAALFGSAASGRMHPQSDIDIFVVRPDGLDDERWWDQLAELENAVTSWTGNDARILEFSHSEVVSGLAREERVLLDITEAGIPLFGPTRYMATTRQRSA